MSVIGIDIGNRYSTIAQAKRGGIDIILNENSKRLNSYVRASARRGVLAAYRAYGGWVLRFRGRCGRSRALV